MYEIWSLGYRPFEELTNNEVKFSQYLIVTCYSSDHVWKIATQIIIKFNIPFVLNRQ